MAVPAEVSLGMAHEIGNLLGAIQLRLQVLRQDATCQRAQGRNLESMARILDEANDLVQKVQALGLSESAVGEEQVIDLDQTVTEAIRLAGNGIRLQARRAGVKLRVEKAPVRLPPVRGVPEQVRRALVDLLLDARQALPRGGTLRVVGRRASDAVILRIESARDGVAVRRARPAGLPLELRLPAAGSKPRRRSARA